MNPIGFNEFYDKNSIEQGINALISLLQDLMKVHSASAEVFKENIKAINVEMKELRKSIKGLSDESKVMNEADKANTAELRKLAAEMAKLKAAYDALRNAEQQQQDARKQNNESTKAAAGSIRDLKNRLNELNKQKLDAAESELAGLGEEAQKLNAEIKRLENTFKTGAQTVHNAAGSYNELQKRTRELANQLKNLPNAIDATTGGINKLNPKAVALAREIERNNKALKGFDSQMHVFTRNVGNYQSALDNIKGSLAGAFGLGGFAQAAAAGGVAGIVAGGVQLLADNAREAWRTTKDLGNELNDLAKFLGISYADAEKFNAELAKVKTTTPVKELREMAVAAGKLNVPNEEILDFVVSMDKASQAMKGEFNMSVDDTAVLLGKLKGLFPETQALSFSTAMEKVSSVLVKAGASGAASGKNIAEFAQRMGALGRLAPTFVQTAAFAAVLEENAVDAQVAAGGLSNVLLVAGQNSAKFATQLGITQEEFAALMDSSPYETVQKLALSLRGLSNVEVAERLKELRIGTQESIKVLSILRDNVENTEVKFQELNKTFGEGMYAANEFAKRMESPAARMELLEKRFQQLGETLSGWFTAILLPFIEAWVRTFNRVEQVVQMLKNIVGGLFSGFIVDVVNFLEKVSLMNFLLDATIKTLASVQGAINAVRIGFIELGDTIGSVQDLLSGKINFSTFAANMKAQGESIANAFKVGFDKAMKAGEGFKLTGSGDSGAPTVLGGGGGGGDAELTVEKLLERRAVLQGLLNAELKKARNLQRPEYLAEIGKEIKSINALLKQQTGEVKLNEQTREQLIKTRTKALSELAKEMAKAEKLQRPGYLAEVEAKIDSINKLLGEQEDKQDDLNASRAAYLETFDIEAEKIKQDAIKAGTSELDLQKLLLDNEYARLSAELEMTDNLLRQEQIKTRLLQIDQERAKMGKRERDVLKDGVSYDIMRNELKQQRLNGDISAIDYEKQLLELRRAELESAIQSAELNKLTDEQILALKTEQLAVDKEINGLPFKSPIVQGQIDQLKDLVNNKIFSGAIDAFLKEYSETGNIGSAFSAAKTAAISLIGLKSLPAFKEGVIGFQGAGTDTSDSNLVRISRNESVIKASATKDAYKSLMLINEGKIGDAEILTGLSLMQKMQNSASRLQAKPANLFAPIDYEAIGRVVAENTSKIELENLVDYIAVSENSNKARRRVLIKKSKAL